ncbi:hypothetical protein ZIOFF_051312 [Zingiber officinale]|uniref:Uncharacterized protein n=1 Tax=Zingiber officinale TaxID=94328 RepID=A0A8J5FK84_ZINOF|nr:hypothetical protein ZIOFF_051312 [Zingiber officinale]
MAAHVASSEVVRSQPSSGGGILARVDRLDIMLGYLEELRGSHSSRSTSAAASGDAGAVTTSEVSISSVDSSPRSTDRRRCRPIGAVVVETQVKGNLMDRVEYLEKRLLKAKKAWQRVEAAGGFVCKGRSGNAGLVFWKKMEKFLMRIDEMNTF